MTMRNDSRQPHTLLRPLAGAFPGGVAYIDRDLVFTFCSEVQAKYLGRRTEEVIGQALHDVIPNDPGFWREIERVVETDERFPQTALSVTWADRPEEGEHHYVVNYVADHDSSGRTKGVYITTLEVTEAVLHEHEVNSGLQERNKALEETVKERDLLIGMLSHELRTPLTTIFGNANILISRLEDLDAESRTQVIRDIREEAERLNGFVENMLLLARSEAQAPVPTEPVAVRTALADVVEEHQRHFSHRSVVTVVKPEGLIVNAQPDYMKQILQNLLSNAEKYSPKDEQIDVNARRAGKEVIISVADRGPGIDPAEDDIIFQPFYRSDRTSMKASGAGIGLAVCKLLAQAQSGRIWIRRRRGGGSLFSFALPAVLAT